MALPAASEAATTGPGGGAEKLFRPIGIGAGVLIVGAAVLFVMQGQTTTVAPTGPAANPAATLPPQGSFPANVAPPVTTTSTARPTTTAVIVRVDGQTAQYEGPCSGYTVTFVWNVRGVQSGSFMYRVAKGDTYGPESGPFLLSTGGNLTWDPSTGRLTMRGAADSSRSPGFKAQVTKVNGRDVEGDATSIANPGYCG